MSSKQRKMERIENAFGSDLVCSIRCDGKTLQVNVADYNALGFQLSCTDADSFQHITGREIQSAEIRYGNFVLGSLTFPSVARSSAETKIFVLVPTPRSSVTIVHRPHRAEVPYLLEPLVTGPDPVRMKEKLIMRAGNISQRGFRAKCSLSNKHLIQGLKLQKFSMMLPTVGTFECNFEIVNVRMSGDYLILGCEFIKTSRTLSDAISDFLLLCTLTGKSESKAKIEKIPKNTQSVLRIRRIDPLRDMNLVLDVRFAAYHGANKLIENATVADMSDEFDRQAIILGAFIGSRIVGTVRVVFSYQGSPLPFEKHFPLPEIKGMTHDNCVEISKMAIDPEFQGSDVLFRLFQAVSLEFIPKSKFALVMSTNALARNYLAIGAKKLKESIPHPVLPGEILNLYMFDNEKLKTGKMSALAWLFFGREIIDFIARFGFARKTSAPVLKLLKAPLELTAKKAKKVFRRRKAS